MFTTATGQTGVDAYVFEAAQIANAQRELDHRFRRLREVVKKENPQLFTASNDFAFAGAEAADHFCWYVQGKEAEYLQTR